MEKKLTPLQMTISELAARPCGVNCSGIAEAMKITLNSAASGADFAARSGRVWALVHPADTMRRKHYFADRFAGAAWLAGPVPELTPMIPARIHA